MSEVYKVFSRQWEHTLDYSEDSLVEMFNHESYGAPISDINRNGYYVGKQWLNVHVQMWKEDILKGYLFKQELYEDPLFPHWWLDSILNK